VGAVYLIESKLGYIRDLGFNCIELMPVHEHAMDRSWGYNPASFFAPESSYRSPATLAHLVDAAHRVGLAVIVDVVYNHAGTDTRTATIR
jgi:1,4-alpha-glucan branching enzyme